MAKCNYHTDNEKELSKDNIFNPDCVVCMRQWANFLEKNNLYVSTDKE